MAMLVLAENTLRSEPVTAFNWYSTAAQKGDVAAVRQSGESYFTEAFQWFTKASEGGDLNALGSLGVLYLNGDGVPARDPQTAVALFFQGAQVGNPYCMFLYGRCLDGGIGVGKNSTEAQRWFRQAAETGHKGAVDWCLRNSVFFVAAPEAQ